MYENNYNYIKTEPIEPDYGNNNNNKKGKGGKILASVLALVIVGGASGAGGAYMYNKFAKENISVSASASSDSRTEETKSGINGTVSNMKDDNTSTPVSSLLTSPNKSEGTLSSEQVFQKVSPSVVCVHSEFENGSGTGTGIVLSRDGYIITNAHVVETETQKPINSDNNYYGNGYNYFDPYDFFFGNGGFGGRQTETVVQRADKVTIILSDDKETEYEAEIIGTDTVSDLAVLKINAENLSAAEFGNSDELPIGSDAYAIGYPMGLGLSMSEGIISGLNRELSVELTSGGSTSMTLIQTDTAINPGNSGGPLINEYGQVVGITSSKLALTTVEGVGFAIPITDAMPLINDLMNQGYVEHHTPQFGITGSNITSAVKRYYGLPVDSGILVVSVEEGSGAAEAGICEGDVIVAADGKEVKSMEDLTAAKNSKEVGDEVVITLARKDGNIDITVTLTEAKEETKNND